VSVQSSEGRAGIQYQLYPIEILRISGGTIRDNHAEVGTVYMVRVLDAGWYGLWTLWYISFLIFVS